MVRRRLVGALVVVLCLFANGIAAHARVSRDGGGPFGSALRLPILGNNRPAPETIPPGVSRIRFVVSSTSDWATVDLWGARVLAGHVVQRSSGASVSIGYSGIELAGPTPASAIVEFVFEVPGATTLAVYKGMLGSVSVQAIRRNTVEQSLASVTISDSQTFGRRDIAQNDVVGEALAVSKLDNRRLTLAFYYPWFTEGTFDSGLWWAKPTGPHDTQNPSDVAAMIDQAVGAGIDGFVVSWDGRSDGGFDLALTQAALRTPRYYVAPLIEMLSIRDEWGLNAVSAQILDVLSRRSNPSFLSIGGRPVVFLYGAYQFTSSQWATVRNQVLATGVQPFFIGDREETSFDFDGVYVYQPHMYASPEELPAEYEGLRNRLRLQSYVEPTRRQRLWAATVSPGYNDAFIRPFNSTSRSRDNGRRYDNNWLAALPSDPEWMMVTSWNEFFEATHIVPDSRNGSQALDQTASWTSSFWP